MFTLNLIKERKKERNTAEILVKINSDYYNYILLDI